MTPIDPRKPNIMFGGWFQVRPGVFGCVAAKCGSQSLKKSAFGVNRVAQILEVRRQQIRKGGYDIGPFTPWEVATMEGRKVLGIREVVDRFSALWRDKALQPNMTKHHSARVLGGMTPDETIAYIERFPFGDSHWFPQAAYMVPGVELVPNDRIYEALSLEPVRINSRPAEVPDLPVDRIRNHYQMDTKIWNSLTT